MIRSMWPACLILLAGCGNATSRTHAHASLKMRVSGGHVAMLSNGEVTVGIDLTKGGSVTWLSTPLERRNMINIHDLGREIQQSYYSGPHPYGHPSGVWSGAGWNPTASGDASGHRPQRAKAVLEGTVLHVSARPLQWALSNVPCECFVESWYSLDHSTVRVMQRLTVNREDHTQYAADAQEVPAAYFNGFLDNAVSYTGDTPFTNAPITALPATWPARRITATENWVALLNSQGYGAGIVSPDTASFDIGFAGKKGSGDEHADQTGYIAPRQMSIIDHNIRYESRFLLTVGTASEIRAVAKAALQARRRPSYVFENDRQGWSYVNARDAGWPIRGRLRVTAIAGDPQIIGPRQPFPADRVRSLFVTASFSGPGDDAQLFWAAAEHDGFSETASIHFPVQSDGKMRTYAIAVDKSPQWSGTVTGLRLDPPGGLGSVAEICSIAATPKPCVPMWPYSKSNWSK